VDIYYHIQMLPDISQYNLTLFSLFRQMDVFSIWNVWVYPYSNQQESTKSIMQKWSATWVQIPINCWSDEYSRVHHFVRLIVENMDNFRNTLSSRTHYMPTILTIATSWETTPKHPQHQEIIYILCLHIHLQLTVLNSALARDAEITVDENDHITP